MSESKKTKLKAAPKTARVFGKGDDLFNCSRCGNCLAICPVYKVSGASDCFGKPGERPDKRTNRLKGAIR